MGARCRLCAEVYEELVEVLEEVDLPAKIFQFFRVNIVVEDRLPTTICQNCYEAIYATWDFNERIQRAQELLTLEDVNKPNFSSPSQNLPQEKAPPIVECVFINECDDVQAKPKNKYYSSGLPRSYIMSCQSKRILELAAQKLSKQVDEYSNEEEAGPSNASSHLQKQYELEEEFNHPFSSHDSINDRTFTAGSAETSDSRGSSYNESDELGSDSDATDESVGTSSRSGNVTPNADAGIHANNWQDVTQSGLNFTLYQQNCTISDKVYNLPTKKPIDIFLLFIDDEIVDLIASETNIYANQKLSNDRSNKSQMNKWITTTKGEILRFFGVTLAMGLCEVPAINLYWSKDALFHNKFISSVLPRDRYLLLLKFIHFSNNENAQVEDKLNKISTLLRLLVNNFQQMMEPGRDLVIDESMIPFRGKLHFRQYIANKTHKYGVKLYKLCTSTGYTYNLKVYAGKSDTNQDVGHAHTIVLKLLEDINPKEGRILFADNFYSSIALTEKLYNDHMLYCGTLRSNRKGIPPIFQKKMEKGSVLGKEKNSIKVIKWVDKRPVLMISTVPSHDCGLVKTDKNNRNGEEILKPKCVIDYNKAKKGVEFSDQMSSYPTVLRKTIKWYRKVVFELLLGTAVVNSWIIYNIISNTKLSITTFRQQLAESLVLMPIEEEEQEDNCTTAKPKRKTHMFVKPDGPGRKKRKVCRECYRKLRGTMTSREADKKVRRIISYCNDCSGQPGMCLECFNKIHK